MDRSTVNEWHISAVGSVQNANSSCGYTLFHGQPCFLFTFGVVHQEHGELEIPTSTGKMECSMTTVCDITPAPSELRAPRRC